MIAEFKVATPVVTNGINMFPNEVDILHSVSYPYLINLEGIINTTNLFYIVLEFVRVLKSLTKLLIKLNSTSTNLDFY